jgi:hypothetical protein
LTRSLSRTAANSHFEPKRITPKHPPLAQKQKASASSLHTLPAAQSSAYQLFGLEQTLALHGYNIAGGAAIGAVAATTYALLKRGPHAVLEPGDDLNMSIDSDMLLPAAVEPTVKAPPPSTPGLEIEILKSKLVKDGLDGHVLALDAAITNNTDYRLKSIDLFLEDDNGRRFPVCAGPEDDCELIFDVNPHSIRRIHFNFQVDYPKLKRKLVWLEHRSQKELITMKLP